MKPLHLLYILLMGTVSGCDLGRSSPGQVRTVTNVNGKFTPVIAFGAPNLYPLTEGPTAIEPMLKSGRWLVIVYSVYSTQDVLLVRRTPEIADSVKEQCRVAIRPTRGFDDLKPWLPEFVQESGASPIWILLEDGVVAASEYGWMEADDLHRFVVHKNLLDRSLEK